MPEAIFVVGGEQRGVPHWTREWKLYKRAAVTKIAAGRAERMLDYESPPEHCADDTPSIVFKAASIRGDRAYLCTQTEVLICDFPSFAIRNVVSLPCFNDLHHVAVAPDGALLDLFSVTGDPVWERFSKATDYRKIATTKPHHAHPNFVFFLDGEPWVTRFVQRDAVPLNGNAKGRSPFKLGMEGVHDGHVADGFVYFTAVNGFVVAFELASGAMRSVDLNQADGPYKDRPLGWCRGILPEGKDVWVGFSRIRYTQLRQNIDWVRHGFRNADRLPPAPTRIARYDFANNECLEEIDLEPDTRIDSTSPSKRRRPPRLVLPELDSACCPTLSSRAFAHSRR